MWEGTSRSVIVRRLYLQAGEEAVRKKCRWSGREGCLLRDFVALQNFVANLRVPARRVSGSKREVSQFWILLCRQGATGVKYVTCYNNGSTCAVAFPTYRNKANLAPGSG
jgi:hypothetical protein